jgi:hypothetical protein
MFSLCQRGRRRRKGRRGRRGYSSQRCYTERPTPTLAEETPLPSSNWEGDKHKHVKGMAKDYFKIWAKLEYDKSSVVETRVTHYIIKETATRVCLSGNSFRSRSGF